MAQQTSVSSLLDMTSSSNVVFLGEAGEEGEWMAPAEILKILHQEVDIPLNAKRVAAFGRILRKQGIPSRHTRKGTVYQLVRA